MNFSLSAFPKWKVNTTWRALSILLLVFFCCCCGRTEGDDGVAGADWESVERCLWHWARGCCAWGGNAGAPQRTGPLAAAANGVRMGC